MFFELAVIAEVSVVGEGEGGFFGVEWLRVLLAAAADRLVSDVSDSHAAGECFEWYCFERAVFLCFVI